MGLYYRRSRNYKYNPNNRDDVRHLPDVVQTLCFAFNRELIGNYNEQTLTRMCKGAYNPLGHPIIDFFDPVSFDILNNGGKISFLNHDDVGGVNQEGSRVNKHKHNNGNTPFKIDFGEKLVHFSGVGTGMNIHTNKNVNVPSSYASYCLDRYALFCKIFYNEDVGIDVSQYKDLLNYKWDI